MNEQETTPSQWSRRNLVGLGLGAAAVAGLAACGAEEEGGTAGEAPAAPTQTPEGPTAAPGATMAGGSTRLAMASDVPVGTVKVVNTISGVVVLSRISETEVKAFGAACPHQGCAVKAEGKQLICPCHNSVFDGEGKNLSGPANGTPLPAGPKVSVQGNDIVMG